MILKILSFCFILLLSSFAEAGSSLDEFQRLRSDPTLKLQLEKIMDVAVRNAFGEKISLAADLSPFFQGRAYPVFVTAKKGEEVRGCMGSLSPKKSSLAEEIIHNFRLAFTRDLRHRPIVREEVSGMEIFVTAVGEPSAVRGWETIVPARDGILLKSGGKEAVVLPGEAKTLRYLKAFARAKAGIGKGEAYQIFKLPTATVSVMLKGDLFSTAPRRGERPRLDPPPQASTP